MTRITGNYLGKVPQDQLIMFSEKSLILLQEACCRKKVLKEIGLQVVLLSEGKQVTPSYDALKY